MKGDDDTDDALLRAGLVRAREYLERFSWCRGVSDAYFGLGVGGVVAVFLFRIEPASGVDEWLWVVVGDIPSAYVVVDNIPSPEDALEVFCELMLAWADAVERHADLHDVFPVDAPATPANAADLRRRIQTIRSEFRL